MTITEVPATVTADPARARVDRPTVVAAALGLLGLVYRVCLLAADVPPTNSDEATMGLAALHISQGRELPAFFYGQAYMGALDAYLAVPLFWLLGPSTVALRLPALLLYAAFVAGAFVLTRRLYSPWLAVVTVGALALGADRVVKNQLVAAGGYPEISPGLVLLLLLSVWLGTGAVRRRTLAFAGWGLVAGLLIWDDWLVMPYLAAAGAVLLAGCGRRIPVLPVAGGLLVGAAPLLAHNLTGSLRENSVSVFLRQNAAGGHPPLGARLDGGVLFGVPMGTGLCSPSQCAPWQMWWTVPYLLLLLAAGVLAYRGLRRAGPAGTAGPDRVVEAARLALVIAALLTILAYARSPSAAETPVESARYLSCLLISLPAALWPLWILAVASARRGRRALAAVAAAPVAALLATMLVATGALVAQAPEIGRRGTEHLALADELLHQGVTRVYADYWTCNRLTFATREQVICAVIADDLRPGYDRYAPYRAEVAAAERPAYALPVGLPLDAAVAVHLTALGIRYDTTEIAGYHVYRPLVRAPLPLPS